MSKNIPIEIQEHIIKRVVNVKSLLRFRSVSIQWKSFIDSSEFITHHHNISINQTHYLLGRYNVDNENKYLSIVDDDSFPQNKFYPVVPPFVKLVNNYPLVFGSSHGLVGLCGFYLDNLVRKNMIVIWNPSIRKSVGIMLPDDGLNALGFGVCPKTYDPKIVKIADLYGDLKADVFTLSTRVWRTILVNPCLRIESVTFYSKPVVINGVIYWIACNSHTGSDDIIISFDLITEEFGVDLLPDGLQGPSDLFTYQLKESLALVDNNYDGKVCDIWMMKKNGDCKSSPTKLFTFGYDNSLICHVTGFRMNGQVIIMQYVDNDDDDDENLRGTLKVYDPSSKHINDLEIDVDALCDGLLKTTSYSESLLMLNQPAIIFQ